MATDREAEASARRGVVWAGLIFAATVAQLAVATFIPGLPQFEGKAFGARLIAYPVMMLAAPAIWWWVRRSRGSSYPMPWAGFALIMAPFLVDISGNTLDLYDSLGWWDDANHFFNWVLLCWGFGLLLVRGTVTSRGWLVLAITGLGALLAIGWELGEWYTFIRHGTEIDTAYEDTLGDEALGTLGGFVAAMIVVWGRRVAPPRGLTAQDAVD
ncbi:MAG: hypothetical protein ABJA81_07385 [Nocardioidaceae bacterium]